MPRTCDKRAYSCNESRLVAIESLCQSQQHSARNNQSDGNNERNNKISRTIQIPLRCLSRSHLRLITLRCKHVSCTRVVSTRQPTHTHIGHNGCFRPTFIDTQSEPSITNKQTDKQTITRTNRQHLDARWRTSWETALKPVCSRSFNCLPVFVSFDMYRKWRHASLRVYGRAMQQPVNDTTVSVFLMHYWKWAEGWEALYYTIRNPNVESPVDCFISTWKYGRERFSSRYGNWEEEISSAGKSQVVKMTCRDEIWRISARRVFHKTVARR